MFSTFSIFIAGAVSFRLVQFLLSIVPNYNIFKQAEFTCLKMLAEIHIQHLTALNVVKVCYEQTDRGEEFPQVEKELNNRYKRLITNCITIMQSNLPYTINYDNLMDGLKSFVVRKEEDKNGK